MRSHAVATALQQALGITPGRARILACLYTANGETVTYDDLIFASSDRPYDVYIEVVKVQVYHLRKGLGFFAIENERGQGYRLSAKGLAKVRAAIEPVEVAA
jgi:DNA-binding response OmpR family regulator